MGIKTPAGPPRRVRLEAECGNFGREAPQPIYSPLRCPWLPDFGATTVPRLHQARNQARKGGATRRTEGFHRLQARPRPAGAAASRGRMQQTPGAQRGRGTLKTLIWQLAECRCSVYSPFSFSLKVSICTRKGTPFSPPCFRMVNSVLMQ